MMARQIINQKITPVVIAFTCLLGVALLFNNCSSSEEESDQSSQVLGDEFSGVIHGALESVDQTGRVSGYAKDPENLDKKMRVHFVVDGPAGQGQYVGNAIADQGVFGSHAGNEFRFDLPSSVTDGRQRVVYAYAHELDERNRLSSSPMGYVAYSGRAEDVFNQRVKPHLSQCASCHTWNYNNVFYGPLLNPAPHEGGTATSNAFYQNANGQNHGGGNFCDGGSTLCNDIRAWWNAEF